MMKIEIEKILVFIWFELEDSVKFLEEVKKKVIMRLKNIKIKSF